MVLVCRLVVCGDDSVGDAALESGGECVAELGEAFGSFLWVCWCDASDPCLCGGAPSPPCLEDERDQVWVVVVAALLVVFSCGCRVAVVVCV